MAQSLRSGVSPQADGRPYRKSPPRDSIALEGLRRLLPEPTPSPRLWADSPGATPVRLCEYTMGGVDRPSKPELSTWLGVGTFYLAPTRKGPPPPNRLRLTLNEGVSGSYSGLPPAGSRQVQAGYPAWTRVTVFHRSA